MLVVAHFLSRLPDLWFVSTFLGCAQAGLIIWVCRRVFSFTNRLFYVASVPVLVSVIAGPSSVEYWNNYFMTFIELFFLLWCLSYLSRPVLWKLPLLAVLVCWAPSLYLAGIVNAVAMTLIGLAMLLFRPPVDLKTNLWGPLAASLVVIGVSVRITWWPYFQSVNPHQLLGVHPYWYRDQWHTLQAAAMGLLGFPVYAPVQWAFLTFLNNSRQLLSRAAFLFTKTTIWVGVIRGALALTAVCSA